MTKIELFTVIASYIPADRTDLTDFINKEIAQVVKKNSYVSSKPTKKQTENLGLRAEVLSVLSKADAPMRISDIIFKSEMLVRENISTQRVSALLTQLKKDGKVERKEGKVATFSLVR